MRFTRRTRLAAALPAAIVLGLATFTASLTWQVPGVRAGSGALDAQATEIVRLINGARVADGLSALNIDPFLAAKARDGAIPCPDDPAKSIAGRAQDFAAYGQMSHSLRLCDAASYTLSGTLFVSLLQSSWSYGSVGEIDLVNGGYGSGAFLYDYHGWQTWTYSTAGNGMLGWQTSSSHWNIIMGGYDRVGCGGWASGSTYYYDCVFSNGGPNGVVSPPTGSPFDNPLPTPPPAPTKAPDPVAPVAPVAPKPVVTACPPTAAPSAAASGSAVAPGVGRQVGASHAAGAVGSVASAGAASKSEHVAGVDATPQNAGAAALQRDGGGIGPDNLSGVAINIAKVVAIIAATGAAMLAGGFLLLSLRRRRRRRETAA